MPAAARRNPYGSRLPVGWAPSANATATVSALSDTESSAAPSSAGSAPPASIGR